MKKIRILLSFLMLSVSFSLGQSIMNASLSFNTGDNKMQSEYYYYRGKKMPLFVNEDKVCISIPDNNEKISETIFAIAKIIYSIKAKDFNMLVISHSDFEKLTSLDSWKECAKSVILTSSFFTENNDEVYATPHLNVQLKKEQDIDLLNSYAEKYQLRIVRNSQLMPLWYILSVTPDSDKTPLECANEMYESGKFASSVSDLAADNLVCSSDPMFNQQWGLYNSGYLDADISASSAWYYATGRHVKIAILDTGVDINHIDLASNISDISYDTESGASPSVVYTHHGTNCAGIAAAIKDNDIQIAGVAPDASIVPISNTLLVSDDSPIKLAEGITWAYQHGVDIISNSWRYPTHHDAIDIAIQNAFRYGRQGKGCVIAFASGNFYGSPVNYPANSNDTILAVGAIDYTGERAFFSDYGPELDIVAPGEEIITTFPNDSVGYNTGTSMACAHVAGVAALILERNPELTVTQVNSIINGNAKKLPIYSFNVTKPDGSWNIECGYGLVDAHNSVINTPTLTYIQNETLTGARIISSDNIYVGRDVTDRKEYGDVILGQGNITLKADYIEIRNSTTVPLGTTLFLKTN